MSNLWYFDISDTSKRPNSSKPMRSGLGERMVPMKCLATAFRSTVERYGDLPFVGKRVGDVIQWTTYFDMYEQAKKVGSQLIDRNLCPLNSFSEREYGAEQPVSCLAVYAKNRPEWFLMEHAANMYGICLVPMYDTLGHDSLVYILRYTRIQTIAVSRQCFPNAIKAASESEWTTTLIMFDGVSPEELELATAHNLKLIPLEEMFLQAAVPLPNNSWSTLSTICYTSGTTGTPKGVKLTHGNLLHCMADTKHFIERRLDGLSVDHTLCHYSYLPLPHIFERMLSGVVWTIGAHLVCTSGDPALLLADLEVSKPNIFAAVPRVLSRIAEKIDAVLAEKNVVVQKLVAHAVQSKIDRIAATGDKTHLLYDALLFKKIRAILGGEVRIIVCGGAPIDASLHAKMQAMFGVPVLQGYGLTETCGISYTQDAKDRGCNVGGPMPSIEACLESVPDMDYDATKKRPKGEVLMRGASIFSGYFGNPAETAKVLDADGWFHTGDVGALDKSTGALTIVDRRKNMFKLAQGEYVAPEKIESVYCNAPSVGQIFVYGDSLASSLVAIIVPNEQLLQKFGKSLNSNAELRELVTQEMNQAADGRLHGFERVKQFHFSDELFSVDNGLLTPTSKLRRTEAKRAFSSEIMAMCQAV
ncbi:MAG: uncharacterized protein KVP18_002783 [Porospora cf. gigantea A]|uniref:uncharacterized protein n=1 Tax=Porospora cf. gigantea A TaxID=2853593 RepID=UPI00355A7080|nr:MAG: hypothetical protein KVP18_002783 [Porospora cf. gigantea A]